MHRISCKDGPVLADGSRAKVYFYRCRGRGPQRKGNGGTMVRMVYVDGIIEEAMKRRQHANHGAGLHSWP